MTAKERAEKIVESLRDRAEVVRIVGDRRGRAYVKTGLSIEDAKQIVEDVLGRVEEGEVVKISVDRGVFIDMGSETVEITGGAIYEYYDYPTSSHLYLRLLRLRYLGREWTAVYIDWDIDSPWWSD